MKGTDVTPEQLAHAESFLRETAAPVPVIGAKTILDVEHLIRLLAWYGAIRAKNGNVNPGRLVTRAADMSAAALECGAASEFIPAPELKDPRDERIRELVVALDQYHATNLKQFWELRTAEAKAEGLPALHGIIERSLGTEVSARRLAQDAKWGGPAHDDTHTQSEWLWYIHDHLGEAASCVGGVTGLEDKLFDIAALAVAAIQSSRRKREAVSE